jgi:hypothetical protein
MNAMVKNYWTTILGAAMAGLIYLQGVGLKLPATKPEWFAFWVGLAVAVVGFVAKDATTGSVPPGARMIALALLLPALVACSARTSGTIDPVAVSAETAAIVGEQAVATNAQYVQLCAAGAIAPAKCQAWATWFTEFKTHYALAHAAFTTSVAAGDIKTAHEAAARIQALSTQLLLYAVYGRR